MVEGGDDRKPQEFFVCLFLCRFIVHIFPQNIKEYAWQIEKTVIGNIKVCDTAFVVLK